jgi:hypothetical protein
MENERHLVPPALERILDQSATELYSECDARCSASHCSLIQPSVAEFTPPGTRIRGTMTAIERTMTLTMKSIWFSAAVGSRRRITILTRGKEPVCALVHKDSAVNST